MGPEVDVAAGAGGQGAGEQVFALGLLSFLQDPDPADGHLAVLCHSAQLQQDLQCAGLPRGDLVDDRSAEAQLAVKIVLSAAHALIADVPASRAGHGGFDLVGPARLQGHAGLGIEFDMPVVPRLCDQD